jgi:WD40 repeat protein/serine/threonine protein kinase
LDPDVLRKLALHAPTPLVRLAERAQNDSSSIRQHHHSYHMFEMWLRVLGAIAVCRYRQSKQHVDGLEERLAALTQPAVGTVLTFVQAFAKAFPKDPIAELLRVPLERNMLPGYRWACTHGGRQQQDHPTVGELSQALASYRNKNIGHGAIHPPEFYREGAEALFESIGAAIVRASESSSGCLLAVDEVGELSDGKRVAVVFELAGSLKTRLVEPQDESRLPELRCGAVYLRSGGVTTAMSLFPWLIWQDDFVLVLSSANKLRAEYLNYYNGTFASHSTLHLAALRAAVGGQRESLPEGADRKRVGHWIGGYEILGVLGQGGMGTVYHARQDSTDMPVALKVLPRQLVGDAVALARFEREAHILTRRDHPNVISVLDRGEVDGLHYYAMDLVAGCTLAEIYGVLTHVPKPLKAKLTTGHLNGAIEHILAKRAADPFRLTCEVRSDGTDEQAAAKEIAATDGSGDELWKVLLHRFAEAADGLAYLHKRGIIHRDIKPSNIMLTEEAHRSVLVDLGIAKTQTGSIHTKTGTFVGTLRYASREQALRSLDELTPVSDLYSLGATMYELLTMTPLYAEDETTASSMSDVVLLRRILDERPAPALERNPTLRPEIGIVLEKLLEKQPDRRFYSSAAELADDLRAICEQRPIRARDYTPEERRAFELFDSVRAQAATWHAEHRPKDLLWGEERQAELVSLEIARRFELSDVEREFLEQTRENAQRLREAREERERRDRALSEELQAKEADSFNQRRRFRWVVTGAVIVGLLGVAVATTREANMSHREAVEARQAQAAAEAAKKTAIEGQAEQLLLKAGQAERESQWDDALLYAAQVLSIEQEAEGPASIQARQILDREAGVAVRARRLWAGKLGSDVRALAWSRDGRWLAAATDQPWLTIQSATLGTGERIPPTQLALGDSESRSVAASALAFSGDGALLAVGGDDGSLETWDAVRWVRRARWQSSRRPIRAVAFATNGFELLSAGDDGSVKAWTLDAAGQPGASRTVRNQGAGITALAISSDGSFAAVASASSDISLLRGPTWAPAGTLVGHQEGIYTLMFTQHALLSGSDDGTVRLWVEEHIRSPSVGESLVIADHHRKSVYAVTSNADATLVASAGAGNAVHLSNAMLQSDVRVLTHLPDEVTALALSPDTRTLGIGLEDGSLDVRAIDRNEARATSPLLGHTSAVENVDFWNGRLVSSGDDDEVRVWDLATGRNERSWSRVGVSGALAVRGRTMLTGARDGSILVLYPDGQQIGIRTGVTDILAVAVSPDESSVAFGAKGGMVGLCELFDRVGCHLWRGHRNSTLAVRFSPDGASLVSGGDEPGAVVWRLEDRRRLAEEGSTRLDSTGASLVGATATFDVAFSRDGSLLATGQHDGRVLVWDARRMTNLKALVEHEDRVFGVAFSPDDRFLASASKDSTIVVWDTATWTPRKLRSQLASVYSVRFSPDGRELASASDDRAIRLWDVTTWTERDAPTARFRGNGKSILDQVTGETGLDLNAGSPRYVRTGQAQ